MFETRTARRVVIIADAGLRNQILEKLTELGATGYNWMECSGQGLHAITGDQWTLDRLVRIEVITTVQSGAAILDYIHATQFHQFSHYALAAFADTVEVDMRDRSLTPMPNETPQ